MKKIITMVAMAAVTVSLNAQEYNLFAPEDVDANGWLWFDTQAKIDKYVGKINDDDYAPQANGKLIQLVYADQQPDYPESTVSVTAVGAGYDGSIGTDGSKTGALVLPASSAINQANGGGFLVMMPSCATYSICLSSESKMAGRILSSSDVTATLDKYTTRYTSLLPFKKIFGAGIYEWEKIETLENDGLTIKSDKPVCVWFQNINKDVVYIHGIKVTTPTQTSAGISTNASKNTAAADVYTIDGVHTATFANGIVNRSVLGKGLYIVKQGDKTTKITIK